MASSESAQECTLCQVPATAKCGRCKNIWFCSELCQKTLWPVHKHLCGGDPKYFRQAPLSDREMNDIEAVKETTACERDCKCNPGMNFRENLTAYPRENARTSLKSSPKILTKPDPRTDYRELCLFDVRRKLRDTYAEQRRAPPVSDPWIEKEWFYHTANWAFANHREPQYLRAEKDQMTAVAA